MQQTTQLPPPPLYVVSCHGNWNNGAVERSVGLARGHVPGYANDGWNCVMSSAAGSA
jgi:hypothetical protein